MGACLFAVAAWAIHCVMRQYHYHDVIHYLRQIPSRDVWLAVALAALAYDATNMLLQAIADAGVDDPTKVAEAMAKGKFEAVSGSITFDEFHTPIKPVTIVQVTGGMAQFHSQVMP